jgi:hypothetical protein
LWRNNLRGLNEAVLKQHLFDVCLLLDSKAGVRLSNGPQISLSERLYMATNPQLNSDNIHCKDPNNFLTRTLEIKEQRLPQLHGVHSVRRAIFSASAVTLENFCYTF